jgi:hypothetical protein
MSPRSDPFQVVTLANSTGRVPAPRAEHGLLEAGDPNGEVRTAWHAKEVVRSSYPNDDPDVADEFVA